MKTDSSLPQVSMPTSQELSNFNQSTESQLLVIVQTATIRELARNTTLELREMLADMSAGLTIEKALNAPKISSLNRSFGEKVVVKLLVVILKAFIDTVRVPVKPDVVDIIEMADILAQKYTHESIKDFLLALRRARTSGTNFYQCLDSSKIYEIFNNYFDSKASYLENIHKDRKSTGPSQDLANVELIAAVPSVATILQRRFDPTHVNSKSLRLKLSITNNREKRGLIDRSQAEEQRAEVQAANYCHASRRQHPTTSSVEAAGRMK